MIKNANFSTYIFIIYNLPFLLCLEMLHYGGFAIAKYDTNKEKYTSIEERDQKNFRIIATVISTLIYIVIFFLIGALRENK